MTISGKLRAVSGSEGSKPSGESDGGAGGVSPRPTLVPGSARVGTAKSQDFSLGYPFR